MFGVRHLGSSKYLVASIKIVIKYQDACGSQEIRDLPTAAGRLAKKNSKPQRHIEKSLCVYVVFYFRMHGNYLINSFAAYLLCESN